MKETNGMKDINTYLRESLNEGALDNIILRNLAEISDNDMADEVKDVMGDDLNSADIIRMWDFLKSKFGKNTKKWLINPEADYQKYILTCEKWAGRIVDLYKLGAGMKKVVAGIGYVINGI